MSRDGVELSYSLDRGPDNPGITVLSKRGDIIIDKVTDGVAEAAGLAGRMKVVGYGNPKATGGSKSVVPGASSAKELREYLTACLAIKGVVHLRVLGKRKKATSEERTEMERLRKARQRERLSSAERDAERRRNQSGHRRSRSSQSPAVREAQQIKNTRAHSQRRSQLKEAGGQAWEAAVDAQLKWSKEYYTRQKTTEEGRAKLAEWKQRLTDRRASWSPATHRLYNEVCRARMGRQRRAENELKRELLNMRMAEDLTDATDLDEAINGEAASLLKNIKEAQLRAISGLTRDTQVKVAEYREEKKARTKEARAALAEAKNATPIPDIVDPAERLEAEKKTANAFRSILSHMGAKPCVSCHTMVQNSVVQNMTQKRFQKLKDEVKDQEKTMGKGFHRKTGGATRLRRLKLALRDVEKGFEKAQTNLAHRLGVPVAQVNKADFDEAFVCRRCWDDLRLGFAPKMGGWNKLEPFPIPEYLGKLGELGQVLVAQRIVLMKMMGLKMGGQWATRGGLVNVVNQVEQTVEQLQKSMRMSLPNTFGEAGVVACELKRKLEYKSVVYSELIDTNDLFEALRELKTINHFYKHVTILGEDEWREAAREEDEELYEALVEGLEEAELEDETEEERREREEALEAAAAEANPLPDLLAAHVDGPQVDVQKIPAYKEAQKLQRALQEEAGEEGQSGDETTDDDALDSLLEVSMDALSVSSPSSAEPSPHKATDRRDDGRTSPAEDMDQGSPEGQGKRKKGKGKGRKKKVQPKRVQVAPGEGQTPIPLYQDENVEALANPLLFPDGNNHFNVEREIPISQSDYYKNRLKHEDDRFRNSMTWVFFAFLKLEHDRLVSSLNVSLRKGTVGGADGEGRVTAGALRDPDVLQAFIAKDNCFRFLGTSRGSPPFWACNQKDLVGMMKMLGSPTFFNTYSANDRNWPEVMRQCWEAEYPGRKISDEEVAKLSSIQRNTLLRKHPTIPAIHFHQRMEKLAKNVINGASRPMGVVSDSFARYEWQERGSPHQHGLNWSKAAPKLGINSEEEICDFIDSTVSGQLPDPEVDKELHDLVKTLQTHSHRPKCQTKSLKGRFTKEEIEAMTEEEKCNARCRYGFPRPVEEKTRLIIPEAVREEIEMLEEAAEEDSEEMKKILREEGKGDEEVEAAVTKIRRELALRRHNLLQSANVEVRLKRRPEDGFVNNYNPTLLRCHRANMDIQYVVNFYAACAYICGYVSKAERQVAQGVKDEVAKLPPTATSKQRMRAIAKAFIRCRLISAQECIHNLLGLPYVKKSRQVVFLANGFPEGRFRSKKKEAELAALPEDSEDVFQDGMIQHYQRRTTKGCTAKEAKAVDEMPLIVFASCFQLKPKPKKVRSDEKDQPEEAQGQEDADVQMETEEESPDTPLALLPDREDPELSPEQLENMDAGESEDEADVPSHFPKQIVLDNGKVFVRRTKRRVVRSYSHDPVKSPEEYAYSALLFYLPFKDEEKERRQGLAASGFPSYEEWFKAKKPELEKLFAEFDGFAELVAEAFAGMDDAERLEAMVQDLEERYLGDGDDEGQDDAAMQALIGMRDPAELAHVDYFDGLAEAGDYVPVPVPVEKKALAASKDELLARIHDIEAKFNEGQRKAYQKIRLALEAMAKAEQEGRTFPGEAIFVSGPGGCGKSFLIEGVQLLTQLLFCTQLDDICSVITATTGTAAKLVGGYTLHNAFSIPAMQKFHSVVKGLSHQSKERLRNRYKDVRLVVLDEVSMCSVQLLGVWDQRLREIFADHDPAAIFGGRIVLFSGDLLQLPPVGGSMIFSDKGMGPFGTHLWKDNVKMVELTEPMRSRKDAKFTETVLRLREANLKLPEDELYFMARTLKNLGKSPTDPDILNILHVYYTNAKTNTFNSARTLDLLAEKKEEMRKAGRPEAEAFIEFKAQTTFASAVGKRLSKKSPESLAPKDTDLCGGLLPSHFLVKGMRVFLRKNVQVEDGLSNGSIGTLRGWLGGSVGGHNQPMPNHLLIDFDPVGKRPVGTAARAEFVAKMASSNSADPQKAAKWAEMCREWSRVWPNWVPVPVSVATFAADSQKAGHSRGSEQCVLRRKTFAVTVGFACTIHRVQGDTKAELVIDLGPDVWKPALHYVAISRLQSLEGLYLLDFCAERINANVHCLIELNRLRAFSGDPQVPLPTGLKPKPKAPPKPQPQPAPVALQPKGKVAKKVAEPKPRSKSRDGRAAKEQRRVEPVAGQTVEEALAALPSDLQPVAKWLVKEFTCRPDPFWDDNERLRQRANFATSQIYARLRELGQTRQDEVGALLRHLRDDLQPRLYEHGRFVVIDDVNARLYKGLQGVLKPVLTPSDGNCWYLAQSISLSGAKGLHRLLRALTTYAMVAAEGFFRTFFLQDWLHTEEEYVPEIWTALYLQEWAGVIHQVAGSVLLGRDVHMFAPCRKYDTQTKRLELVGRDTFRGDPDRLSLAQLHDLYEQGTEGLANQILIPGGSVVLGWAGREPIRTYFKTDHYTALLPNPLNHNLAHIPVPQEAPYGDYRGAVDEAPLPAFLAGPA